MQGDETGVSILRDVDPGGDGAEQSGNAASSQPEELSCPSVYFTHFFLNTDKTYFRTDQQCIHVADQVSCRYINTVFTFLFV